MTYRTCRTCGGRVDRRRRSREKSSLSWAELCSKCGYGVRFFLLSGDGARTEEKPRTLSPDGTWVPVPEGALAAVGEEPGE